VIVNVKVVEGDRSRVQAMRAFASAVPAAGSTKASRCADFYGEGVERVFPGDVADDRTRSMVVRAARCAAPSCYLRNLRGKSARIVEKKHGTARKPLLPPSASNFRVHVDLTKSAGLPALFLLRIPI